MASGETESSDGGGTQPGLASPLVVGDYELFRVLGRGAVGTTYLGKDRRNGQLVAVKALQLLRSTHRHHIGLFEREAETLAELSHPQIPKFHETMVREGSETFTLYLVQQYVEGRSLYRMLSEGHRFEAADVVSIMLSCLEPLEYLHSQSPPLYHRDLKPSNIIHRTDGTCVLIDFGAVREALGDPNDAGSSVVGTFGYMAPEQFQARVNPATDLYSLGATALHLLTGRPPQSFEIRRLKPDFHHALDDGDPHLTAILDLLLEPVDEDRYRSARSLRRALDRWLAEHPSFGSRRVRSSTEVERAVTDSVTRSPIIMLSPNEPPPAPSEEAPSPTPERSGDPDRETPRVLDAVNESSSSAPHPQAMAALPDEGDDDGLKEISNSGPTRPAPEGYPAPSTRTGVPINKKSDSAWAVLHPGALGNNAVGAVLFGLAAAWLAVATARDLGTGALVLGALLALYGTSYFWFVWQARRRNRIRVLAESTDGRLLSVDLHTTALGERYVTLHYEFSVGDTRYTGTQTYSSRREALQFLRRDLTDMVWYDEAEPRRNHLERS